ncbi:MULTISPECIES: hypothetical protein [unclassified Lentimonas]|uniref:hypothetical protein n=1 Tax=unclassified Lentimonas TaxID=2630993 RepID=UPI0013236923|nr:MULTISPECIES: hypothetical protein [unclassified Lentimonas]CAA6692635.1 Unannotated [Lentimonas sp. CC19]CAA6696979.1 Unannotated [Lentimonas sp. CC10]CAA7071003.1 Unannotated [Lentimonas sp. CC11]
MITVTKVEKLKGALPRKIDVLVACASFEARGLTACEIFDQNDVAHVALFHFDPTEADTTQSIRTFDKHFPGKLAYHTMNHSKPESIARAIMSALPFENSKDKEFVVDISTFTKEALLVLLKFFTLFKDSFPNVTFFYRTADVSQVLSNGILQIRSVPGYMGDFEPELPLHIIVLSGFEFERAKGIIDTIEPDYITIGSGAKKESISDEMHDDNVHFTSQLSSYYSNENVNTFECSLRDPICVRDTIIKLIKQCPKRNYVIAPLNNKISTIGAGLAAIENPNIQICYAQMASYNPNYSTPSDNCIIFKLNNLTQAQT